MSVKDLRQAKVAQKVEDSGKPQKPSKPQKPVRIGFVSQGRLSVPDEYLDPNFFTQWEDDIPMKILVRKQEGWEVVKDERGAPVQTMLDNAGRRGGVLIRLPMHEYNSRQRAADEDRKRQVGQIGKEQGVGNVTGKDLL